MVLQDLTVEQQSAFLALAKRMVAADGVFEEYEVNKMMAFQAQMPLARVITCQPEQLASIFNDRRSRISALVELAGINDVTEELRKEEEDVLKEIARSFSIDETTLGKLRLWVKKQLTLIHELNVMMEG